MTYAAIHAELIGGLDQAKDRAGLLLEEVADARANSEIWRGLVIDLVDAEDCSYDHNGLCQVHSLHERPCPHEQAKALLKVGTDPNIYRSNEEKPKHTGEMCAYAYWDADDWDDEGNPIYFGPMCGCEKAKAPYGGGAAACGAKDCEFWTLRGREDHRELPATDEDYGL